MKTVKRKFLIWFGQIICGLAGHGMLRVHMGFNEEGIFKTCTYTCCNCGKSWGE